MSLIWINDIPLPFPDRGFTILRSQLVDSGRNASGEVVAQKVNRRLHKIDSLKWSHLTAAQWSTILAQIELFEGTVRFWDARTNGFLEIKVYWGDSSEEPFEIIDSTGEITEYINCSCNIIDMGF